MGNTRITERYVRRTMRNFDEEVLRLIGLESARSDPRTSMAAMLIKLVHVGVDVKEYSTEAMVSNLARVAEEHSLTPEDIQEILVRHEPSLGEMQHG
jgi:hypothetical protein